MSKQKILIVVVVILVIINIASLSFLWFSKPEQRHNKRIKKRPDVEQYLTRKLKLSKDQAEAFKDARERHFEQTNELLHSLHDDRKMLTSMLSKTDTVKQNDLINQISNKRTEFEILNFRHLQNLRSICTIEQKQKFDSVIFKVIDKGSEFREGMKARKKRK